MSRFDDEGEYEGDEFDSPDEPDPVVRELRAEIIRLEAQLDQLTAGVREQTQEYAALAAQVAELKVAVARLRARQRRDAKLLLLAWLVVVASLGLSLYTYFAQ